MTEFNLSKAVEIFQTENNISKACRIHCEEIGIEYSEKYRNQLSRLLRKGSVDEDLDNIIITETAQYKPEPSNMPSAWNSEAKKFYTIEEFCEVFGLDIKTVKSSKLCSHNASHMTYNIAFFTDEEEIVKEIDNHLEEIIQKYIKPIETAEKNFNFNKDDWFDRLVFTDVHIGMDVSGNGDPLYEGVWNREELLKRLDIMVNHTKEYQKSKHLVISNLGDYMDGLGGQTTRKGHTLPQNMNDKEAFDLGVEFSLRLVDSLVDSYDKIDYNFLVEDNHSGVFSYFVAQAVKSILEQRYLDKVTVKSQKKFIDHFKIGKHTIVETHGKDSESLKFGFKPHLDDRQAKKIDHYLKENGLYDGNYIEFSKGDSHLGLFDDSTSTDFQYYNYPSFSPPSNWVKSNFSNTKSGFRFFNINKNENIKNHFPYWF
jgi:hypothetical protein